MLKPKIIIVILILSACRQSTYEYHFDKVFSINIDSILSDKPIYYSQLFSNFKIIPLEYNQESSINTISKLKFINDTFFVFDKHKTKSLLQFSREGKYINKICKIGRDLGEYISPMDFDIDENSKSIFIYDWDSKKLNVYDTKGNFLKYINIKKNFYSFSINSDRGYFFTPRPNNLKDLNSFLLFQFDLEGNYISEHFKYKDFGNGINYNIFNMGGNFFKTTYDTKFFMPFCNIIFSIEKNHLKPYISLNTNIYKISKEDINLIKNSNSNFLPAELQKLNKLYNISYYCENKNIGFIKFNIGRKVYWTILNFNTGNVICSSNRVDNLSNLCPDIFMINEHQFAGIIDQRLFSKFKEIVSSNRILMPLTENVRNSHLTEFENPLIIIYDVK